MGEIRPSTPLTSKAEEVTVFKLELLIGKANDVNYNKCLIPGKTLLKNGNVTVYDPIKERNVAIPCNNKDGIEREELPEKGYIKYSILATESRVAEFKTELIKFARNKENDLKEYYQEQVLAKTDLVNSLDDYLDQGE